MVVGPMQDSSQNLDAWNRAVEHIRSRSPATFEQWFSNVQFDRLEDGVLELTARNDFVREWVKMHFLPTLVGQLRQLLPDQPGNGVRVEWRVSSELACPVCHPSREASHVADLNVAPPSQIRSRPLSDRPPVHRASRAAVRAILNPKHTFENFVVGPSNELARAAAYAAAGGAGRRFNPLFLAGGTGLGKTHLMHAIAHKVVDDRPDSRIVFVSSEHFTNEFIQALQHHRMEEFRARYRSECDLLLLDDIQFLAGREQTQEEFFHTFNALRDVDRQIVVTADKYPHELQRMPERLVSRFTSGLVADIQVPQLETRAAIVRKKAELEGILVSDDVAVLLAQTVRSNVRELEGALIRLAAKASLTGQPIDLEFARREMTSLPAHRPALVGVEDIQRAVCGHFRLSSSELLSKDRHKSVAFARQVAMYLCRQRLKCSFPELGRHFGNRDHTTVMSAVRRIEEQAQKDPEVKAHLEAIERRLASAEG
jgi:chromosomal replication initiator protein